MGDESERRSLAKEKQQERCEQQRAAMRAAAVVGGLVGPGASRASRQSQRATVVVGVGIIPMVMPAAQSFLLSRPAAPLEPFLLHVPLGGSPQRRWRWRWIIPPRSRVPSH